MRRLVVLAGVFLLLCLGSSSVFAQSATIRGVITDATTQEPLIGATVVLSGTSFYGIAGMDGSYVIRDVPFGEYEVEVSFVSFQRISDSILVQESTVRRDYELLDANLGLDAVEVIGLRDLASEEGARASERLADNVINVMPARAIELSPDITVANVLQRVSGVSLERTSSGEGQYAIVRGMDKRYNSTLVNGIKIPSPDPRHRYVPLDIFPAELLDRLEVSKALTPSMEGDAIGGVIDMRMRAAPSRRLMSFNVGSGISASNHPFERFDGSVTMMRSPRTANGNDYRADESDFPYETIDMYDSPVPLARTLGFAVGDRFLNNQVGVIVAGSYSDTYRGSDGIFFEMDVDREDNNPFYDIVQNRRFSVNQSRGGVHAKVDWAAHPDHRFDLYSAYIQLRDAEVRTRVDTNLRIGRAEGPGTGRIEHRMRTRQQTQRIMNTTLQGTHNLALIGIRVDWSAAFSRATLNDPDMAEVQLLTGATRADDGSIQHDEILLGRDLNRRWMNNVDQDLAFYLNLHRDTRLLGYPTTFSAGGMFRTKSRSNEYDNYLLRASPILQVWESDHINVWDASIYNHSWSLMNPGGTPTDPLNYDSGEEVGAYYAQARVEVGRLQVLGGVRVEHTWFEWETDAPSTVEGRIGDISYTDILPSIHFKFSPTSSTNYRLSYFSSISRPSFFEVVPYQFVEGDYWERGNPELNRTRANNVDLRFEHYPSAVNQFMVGVFYKRLVDPIESALAIDGQRIFMQPNNFGVANNFGVEIDVTQYFRQFGVRAFYTYTNSSITTTKIVRYRDDDGSLTSRHEEQTRPMQGQSRHIGNLSFLFKEPRTGTDVQLALSYTGRRIIGVSPYFENDIWQRGHTKLDLSIEQHVFGPATIYLKANNLLNAPMRADILRPNTANPHEVPYEDVSESVKVQEDFYGRTFVMGVKVRL